MLRAFFNNLENEKYPLLGPTLWGLTKWGIWCPKKILKIPMAIHIAAIIFVVSQYVELWFICSDLNLALRNLSVTMLSTVCVTKAGTFLIWQDRWKDVVEYVTNLEKYQLSRKDKVVTAILEECKRYSRRVTYFYWSLVAATVLTVTLAPLVAFWSSKEYRARIRDGTTPYPEILSSWLPFDRTRGSGYWISVVEHVLICIYGGGVVASYDSNATVLMTFFAGQFKVLNVNCERLFDHDDEKTDEEKIRIIGECHNHHLLLIKHAKILNSLLSPVMFLYVIICSLMLCASAIQMNMDGTTNMQRIWLAEYLIALIAQLFLYCWHSNEVLIMSNKVEDGVFASAWWRQSFAVHRCILLLGGKLRKRVHFTAGPFTHLDLPTLLAILKGSYSYYTLLSNKDD